MKRSIRFFLLTWGPVLLWMSVIFYISSYPTIKTSTVQWEDFSVKKLAHVLEYGFLAILMFRALRREGIASGKAGILAVLFVFLYGSSDEIHQRFTTGRDSKFRDVLIDTFGSGVAIAFLWKLLPKAPQKLKKWGRKLELL